MAKTKSVGVTGKFGARYGKKIRQRIIDVERIQRKKHSCPSCFKLGIKRVSSGVWVCKKCGLKFSGKAYKPS